MPYPLMASIGNNRPNAISENGPSCDPDYERNGELHHVSFRLWFREPGGGGPPPAWWVTARNYRFMS